MNGYLLDACALIALLNDEPGAQHVEAILSGDTPVYMSAINTLEVAYDAVRRSKDNGAAAMTLSVVSDANIEILWSLTVTEWLAAARWKARGRLSLADSIALAIAETRNLKLVSADHHELDPLEAEGLIQVEWLR